VPAAPALLAAAATARATIFVTSLSRYSGGCDRGWPGYICCDGMGSGNLHLIGYTGGTGIKRTAEYAGKRKHVVDLFEKSLRPVPTIAAPALLRHRPDFRHRVCHRKDDRVPVHRPDHLPVTTSGAETPMKTSPVHGHPARVPARRALVSSAMMNLYLFRYSPSRRGRSCLSYRRQ